MHVPFVLKNAPLRRCSMTLINRGGAFSIFARVVHKSNMSSSQITRSMRQLSIFWLIARASSSLKMLAICSSVRLCCKLHSVVSYGTGKLSSIAVYLSLRWHIATSTKNVAFHHVQGIRKWYVSNPYSQRKLRDSITSYTSRLYCYGFVRQYFIKGHIHVVPL